MSQHPKSGSIDIHPNRLDLNDTAFDFGQLASGFQTPPSAPSGLQQADSAIQNWDWLVPAGDVVDQLALGPDPKFRSSSPHDANHHAHVVQNATTTTNFPGTTGITFAQSGGYYPPDNGLAVGNSVVITAENDAIQISTKAGASPATESLETFFASVMQPGFFLTDPVVRYDQTSHRFVVTVDEVSNDLSTSYVLVAASTSDPGAPSLASLSSSNWHFQAVSTSPTMGGLPTWSDQPLVSIDANSIYISTNQFNGANGPFEGTLVTVLDKGIYGGDGGSTVHSTTFAGQNMFSYQPAVITPNSGAVGSGDYLVSYTGNNLSVFEANGGANTTPVNVPLGNIDHGSGDYTASQLGTSYQLDAGDGRVNSVAYDAAHQILYAVFEVLPANSKTPSVEWVQLDMSAFNSSGGTTAPTLMHEGFLNSLLPITGATKNATTFNASVAVDGNGDALFNFTVSGPKMYPADYYTVWKGAGAGGTPSFSTPVDYHNSVAAYIDPAHDHVGRWGDYSTATAEPASSATFSNGFYISNEFDNGFVKVGGHSYSSWGTSIAHILV